MLIKSEEAKWTVVIILCLGIGFIVGQMATIKSLSIESMKEAHLFGVHSAYLRGCVENAQNGFWLECVNGARKSTQDVREILTKEPERLFHPPQQEESSEGTRPDRGNTNPPPEFYIKTQKKPIVI